MATIKSVEEKAKAYDEAIKRARKVHNETEFDYEKGMMEEIFPELKESEDERIRKELISHFNSYKANCSSDWYGIKVNSIIAWLENQERTMHTKNSDDFIVKSEGLDEVEKYILSLVPSRSLDAIKVDAKSLRFLVEKEQKPTEWSEEDLQMLQDVISGLEATKQLTYAHEPQGKAQMQERIDWLKSLRPQNRWKPSDEQMDALLYIVKHYTPTATEKLAWDSLQTLELMLEQLKKLRDE